MLQSHNEVDRTLIYTELDRSVEDTDMTNETLLDSNNYIGLWVYLELWRFLNHVISFQVHFAHSIGFLETPFANGDRKY